MISGKLVLSFLNVLLCHFDTMREVLFSVVFKKANMNCPFKAYVDHGINKVLLCIVKFIQNESAAFLFTLCNHKKLKVELHKTLIIHL